MIPTRLLADWRPFAPWPDEDQVEQDLVPTRVLIALFSEPRVGSLLAFRGGTAIHKTALPKPLRYSEDIDLVQREPEPIKPALVLIQPILDPWLGSPSIEQRRDAVRLVYRYHAEGSGARRRAKVEINTREHGAFDAWRTVRMSSETRWYRGAGDRTGPESLRPTDEPPLSRAFRPENRVLSPARGEADVVSFSREELLSTKLRLLYQRKKGRDLFDLDAALLVDDLDEERMVSLFRQYLDRQGVTITRREFEANMDRMLTDPLFVGDVHPLLRHGQVFDPATGWERVKQRLVSRLG